MRSAFIIYVMAFYIIGQFTWWAFLLVEQNDEIYRHRIENVRLTHAPDQAAIQEGKLEKKMKNRRWMVVGEGGVFLSLLLWGSIMTFRTIRKEVSLAQMQKNFLLSITHEFKSPLASIKLYLQTLQKHDLNPEQERSFISSAINDTDRLNNLVENTLLASLIDHNGYHFDKEALNFSALVRLMIQKFQSVPGRNKIIAEIEENLFIDGDKNALMILLQNLLENAMKYSPKESPIHVQLTFSKNKILLFVKDEGVGIADTEKKRIFEKFYRIGNEETRRTKGTGLGLFIVRYIASGHDAVIQVKDNTPRGSMFCMQFQPSLSAVST